MKIEIKPTAYNMPSGIHTAQIADINIVSDNMKDTAVFGVQLQTIDKENIDDQLRIIMAGEAYESWDNSNESAITFVLNKLQISKK